MSKSQLPPINQQDKTVEIGGKTFTFEEVLNIVGSAVSLDHAARKHGLDPNDLRNANAYVKNYRSPIIDPIPNNSEGEPKKREDTEQEKELKARAIKNQKLLENLLILIRKNILKEQEKIKSAGFFGGMGSRVSATKMQFQAGGFEALLEESQKTPEILESMKKLIEKQTKIYEKSLEIDKIRDRKAEEDRLENLRKYGNEKGYANWLVNGSKDRKDPSMGAKLAEGLGGLAGNLLGMLVDPKLFTALIGFDTLKRVLPRLLRSRLSGVAIAMISGAFNAIDAVGNAEKWGVSSVSAALGGFLGGSEKGGLINALTGGAGLAFTGAMLGAPAGPVGIIAGALIGGALGVISGLLGAEKLSKMIDEATSPLSDWVNKNILISHKELAALMSSTEAFNTHMVESLSQANNAILDIEKQIEEARASGNTARLDELIETREIYIAHKEQIESDMLTSKAQLEQQLIAEKARSTAWWRATDWLTLGYTKLDVIYSEWVNQIRLDISNAWDKLLRNAEDTFKTQTMNIGNALSEWNYDTTWIGEGMESIMSGIQTWWNGLVEQFKKPFQDPAKFMRQVMGLEPWDVAAAPPRATSYDEAVSMGATSYDFDGLSVPVYKAPAKPEVTTDFFVMKHLRDLEMKKKIQERNQVYGQIAPANLGQSQANPSVVAAMTNNQSVNNVSATSISAPISPLNQTIVGNW